MSAAVELEIREIGAELDAHLAGIVALASAPAPPQLDLGQAAVGGPRIK